MIINLFENTFCFPKALIGFAGAFIGVKCTKVFFEFESDITREQVISLIGTEAEKLVYLFCSLENRTLQILQHKFEPELQKDLYKLEYANLLEDTSHRSKTSQSISPLMVFILNLIRSNLKDHYSIPLPPIPFQPIIVE